MKTSHILVAFAAVTSMSAPAFAETTDDKPYAPLFYIMLVADYVRAVPAEMSLNSVLTGPYGGFGVGASRLSPQSSGNLTVDAHMGYALFVENVMLAVEAAIEPVASDLADSIGEIKEAWSLSGRLGYDFDGFRPYISLGGKQAKAELLGSNYSDIGIIYGVGFDVVASDRVNVGAQYTLTEYDEFSHSGYGVSQKSLVVKVSIRF